MDSRMYLCMVLFSWLVVDNDQNMGRYISLMCTQNTEPPPDIIHLPRDQWLLCSKLESRLHTYQHYHQPITNTSAGYLRRNDKIKLACKLVKAWALVWNWFVRLDLDLTEAVQASWTFEVMTFQIIQHNKTKCSFSTPDFRDLVVSKCWICKDEVV